MVHAPHEHNVLYKSKNNIQQKEPSQRAVVPPPRDPVLLQRDRAVLALYTYLNMDLDDAEEVVDAFPDLYLKCPSLGSRILYMQHELGLAKPKMVELLKGHPSMVITILLNNPEQHLVSTVEVLQTELNLSLEDITENKFNNLYRTAVRARIQLLREIFPGSNSQELKEIILKDPRLLSSSASASNLATFQSDSESTSYSDILAVLRNELQLSNVQLGQLIRSSPHLLLMDHAKLQKASSDWYFILKGPIGDGLGRVKRRGIDTTLVTDPEEQEMVVLYRAQELILRVPELLTSSHFRNTVAFFVEELRVSPFNFGRIVYRQPRLLYYDPSRLREKVEFFRKSLDFPDGQEGTDAIIDMISLCPDVFTQSIENNVGIKIDYFRNEIGMNTTELRDILSKRPQILAYALDGSIRLKVDLLVHTSKIPMEVVRTMIVQYPQVLRENLKTRLLPRCNYLLEIYPDGIPCPSDKVPIRFLHWTDQHWRQWKLATFETEQEEEQEETTIEIDTILTDDDKSAKALDINGDKVQVKAPKAKKAAKGSRKKAKGVATSKDTTLETEQEKEQEETTELETTPTDDDTSAKALDVNGDKVKMKALKAKKAAKGSRKKAKGAVASKGIMKEAAKTKGAKKGARKNEAVEEA